MVRLDESEQTVVEYLVDHDILSRKTEATVTELGGGVSNTVLRVDCPESQVIVKQPLANLSVAADWPADRGRVHNEAAAARVYANICTEKNLEGIRIPEIIYENREDHVIVISSAPAGAITWKRQLLAGSVDIFFVESLATFLATTHTSARQMASLRDQFDTDAPFIQLRIDPYHQTVAEKHPQIADHIAEEIDRIRATKQTLVHGDFSPKNVLVEQTSERTPTLWIIDFEVAHWGDPMFDVAFMINHLLIKSVKNETLRDRYRDAAQQFWEQYTTTGNDSREADMIRELAILMLARVDGTSPVEYLEDDRSKSILRRTSITAIETGIETLSAYLLGLEEERQR